MSGWSAVNIGAVEVSDAVLHALLDDRVGAGLIDLAADVVAAEPERRDDEARAAKVPIFHVMPPAAEIR